MLEFDDADPALAELALADPGLRPRLKSGHLRLRELDAFKDFEGVNGEQVSG